MARWAAQHVPACAEDTPRFDELCGGEALAHVGDLGAAQQERLLLGRERVGAAPAFLKLVHERADLRAQLLRAASTAFNEAQEARRGIGDGGRGARQVGGSNLTGRVPWP